MDLSRRDIWRMGLGLPMALGTWRLWASPTAAQDAPRFLLVFLRGAYDGLHAVVPYADAFYRQARPRIAVPGPGQEGACLPLDGRWGLHPALAPTLGPMWSGGELLLVPFAGTSFVSRSHFEAQDRVEMAGPDTRGHTAPTGFMNRLLQELGGSHQAVSFTPNMPVAMRGTASVVNAEVSRSRGQPPRPLPVSQQEALLALYQGHPLAGMWQQGLGLENALRTAAIRLEEEAQLAQDPASRQALLPSAFALQAARMAQLLKDQPQFRLGMIDVGGWDTHAYQGGATGALASRLKELGEGLAALSSHLGAEQWRKTVVVVLSEFGRTFHENGTGGTDHGHGSTLWVLGGAIRGGRIAGEQVDLTPDTLHQQRDLPVLNEYRSLLAGIFQKMYGLLPTALSRVFPELRLFRSDLF